MAPVEASAAVSGSREPVLDLQLVHWEVPRITGDKARTNTYGRGCDHAVRLTEGESTAREVSAPPPGALPLGTAERSDAETSEEARHSYFLLRSGTTQNLLDVYRTDVRQPLAFAQRSKSPGGSQSSQ